MLTRQYEERGTLLAKSKVGRNPENPRFSWLLPVYVTFLTDHDPSTEVWFCRVELLRFDT